MKKVNFIVALALIIAVAFGGCKKLSGNNINIGNNETVDINKISANTYVKPEVAGAYTLWNFENGLEGFQASLPATVKSENKKLIFNGGKGNYLLSEAGLNIPANAVKTIEFRATSNKANQICVYWRTAEEGFSENNKAQISIKADNKIHDYQIELGQHKFWVGTIVQLRFEIVSDTTETVNFDFIKTTGIYFVPFPWISGDFSKDVYILKEMKQAFGDTENTAVFGFSVLTEYLSFTDDAGNYKQDGQGTLHDPKYMVKLAKAVDMPVMIWLRADPWGYSQSGLYNKLWTDDQSVMWTSATDQSRFYRNTETGFGNLCLAQNDLNGKKTNYWDYTEKNLKQAADVVDKLIKENPGYILGITTTSEYRFATKNEEADLDYNPRTIKEFRDYCKIKYDTIAKFNAACSTNFSTYELLSTDYNPATIENVNGFDAPRKRYSPREFWQVWTDFRGSQISNAVKNLVNIISQSIDSKYIYTHQIAYDNFQTSSPIETGNVKGSNMGIDFFNYEVTDDNMSRILKALGNDYSRSWGCPEWLVTQRDSFDKTYAALSKMLDNGAKYICPFAWGCGGDFEIKKSPSVDACRKILMSYARNSNVLLEAKVAISSNLKISKSLIDQDLSTLCKSSNNEKCQITFELDENKPINQMSIFPQNNGMGVPKTVELQNEVDGKFVQIAQWDLSKFDGSNAVTLNFQTINTKKIKLIFTPKSSKDSNDTIAISEIKAGYSNKSGKIPGKSPSLNSVNKTATNINLSWKEVGGDAISYYVEVSKNKEFSLPMNFKTDKIELSFKIPSGDAKYFYRVWAVNAYGATVSDVGSF